MSEIVYEVRVAGLVPAEDLDATGAALQILARQYRTVLVGRFAHRDGLLEFLRELRNHGFAVVNVRRLPGHADGRRSEPDADRTAYEVTVPGEVDRPVGRLLESFRVVLTELHTVLRARAAPGVGPVELGLILESRGMKIASIRAVPGPARVPAPRDKAESPEAAYDGIAKATAP